MKKCPNCTNEMTKVRHLVRDEAKYKCTSCGKVLCENTRYRKERVLDEGATKQIEVTTECPTCHQSWTRMVYELMPWGRCSDNV